MFAARLIALWAAAVLVPDSAARADSSAGALAAQVADQTGLAAGDAELAVDAVFEAIRAALTRGESVSIAGFGTFTVRQRPARCGRDPRTGERISIPASTTPVFKAGKTLNDALLELSKDDNGHGMVCERGEGR